MKPDDPTATAVWLDLCFFTHSATFLVLFQMTCLQKKPQPLEAASPAKSIGLLRHRRRRPEQVTHRGL